ncbi:hypothetical protein AMECASPLE_032064 [Ameca splendens]|uniref:Transmembrane protein n=1 Tax=Ameca splendens TaxID=208324 RepID=A0ABV0ZF98_9TELE
MFYSSSLLFIVLHFFFTKSFFLHLSTLKAGEKKEKRKRHCTQHFFKRLQSFFMRCSPSFRAASAACSLQLLEQTAGLPHFLACLHKFKETARDSCVCFNQCVRLFEDITASQQHTHIFSVDAVPLSHLHSILSCPPSICSSFSIFPSEVLLEEKSLVASLATTRKQHTSNTLPFLSLPLSLSQSACLSVFRVISQGFIVSLFPNRISLPCCQTGFSKACIAASCFKNLSLKRLYSSTH